MESWCEWLTPHFTIAIINTLSTNLVSQSHTIKIDYSWFISTIYTFVQFYPHCVWRRSSGSARSVVLRLRPLTEVVLPLSVLYSVYVNIWLLLVAVYTNQRSKSLDYPGQDRLPNWPSGAPQPLAFRRVHAFTPSYCSRDADSVASLQSAPFRVQYCLYSESGLFWASS